MLLLDLLFLFTTIQIGLTDLIYLLDNEQIATILVVNTVAVIFFTAVYYRKPIRRKRVIDKVEGFFKKVTKYCIDGLTGSGQNTSQLPPKPKITFGDNPNFPSKFPKKPF